MEREGHYITGSTGRSKETAHQLICPFVLRRVGRPVRTGSSLPCTNRLLERVRPLLLLLLAGDTHFGPSIKQDESFRPFATWGDDGQSDGQPSLCKPRRKKTERWWWVAAARYSQFGCRAGTADCGRGTNRADRRRRRRRQRGGRRRRRRPREQQNKTLLNCGWERCVRALGNSGARRFTQLLLWALDTHVGAGQCCNKKKKKKKRRRIVEWYLTRATTRCSTTGHSTHTHTHDYTEQPDQKSITRRRKDMMGSMYLLDELLLQRVHQRLACVSAATTQERERALAFFRPSVRPSKALTATFDLFWIATRLPGRVIPFAPIAQT